MVRLESAPPTRRTRSGGDGETIPEIAAGSAVTLFGAGAEVPVVGLVLTLCGHGSLTSESVEKGCAGGGS